MLILVTIGIGMKKIKVGQIGKGSFGDKILSKLNLISDVSLLNEELKLNSLVISSPVITIHK